MDDIKPVIGDYIYNSERDIPGLVLSVNEDDDTLYVRAVVKCDSCGNTETKNLEWDAENCHTYKRFFAEGQKPE